MTLICEVSGKPTASVNGPGHAPTSADWDVHWRAQRRSLFGRICSLYRRHIRARSVAYHFERFFPPAGIFAECGSGSSETSCRIKVRQRTLVAIDFSSEALLRASCWPQIKHCVQADIRSLPFEDQSLDGIWNLGVMEHFPEDEQRSILGEFRRVLKIGGRLMMWWPPRVATDYLLLSPFGWRFPAEPGRLAPSAMRERCESSGFSDVNVCFPLSDCGTECLVRAVRAEPST